MKIVGVGAAFPEHRYEQETILTALADNLRGRLPSSSRLRSIHQNARVRMRHLALPIEHYRGLDGWGDANDAWLRVGVPLGESALVEALGSAGLEARELDAVYSTTVTGVATPSLEARLANRMGFRSDVKRVPIFGLGCVAGAAGVARVADYVRAFPGHAAALVSVELCSLTLQRADLSVANLIASALFGDGAAACVIVGDDVDLPGPRIVATRSVFYPDSERVMGWDVSEHGFGIVLSAEVPDVVRRHVREDVDAFLRDNGLRREDVGAWICHPGGPRVIEAIRDSLELDDDALRSTWETLEARGNLSSASVLLVLGEFFRRGLSSGTHAVMMAMGPGFCSELVLLQW